MAEPTATPEPTLGITNAIEFQMVPTASLRESRTNPRRHFDERGMQELTESVRTHGVLVPLLIRPLEDEALYQIICGARRFRAAQAAQVPVIPARVRHMTDIQVLELQLVENLQREDVHPLDEATGYRALMDTAGYDAPGIAAKIGKSLSYVYGRLKLAELIPRAQKAFLDDTITAGHAILIARLQPINQTDAMAACLEKISVPSRKGHDHKISAACSVRELATWIERNIHLDLHAAPWKKDNANLVPEAGPCITCPKRTGFQPALFPDIAKKDTCTDPTCYQAKTEAFLTQRKQSLSTAKTSVLELSREYHYTGQRKTRGLGSNEWREATRACLTTAPGLIVEGPDIGASVIVCRNSKCKEHRQSWEPSPAQQARTTAKRKAKEAKDRHERAVRTRLLELIVDRAEHRHPPGPSHEDLSLITRRLIAEMHHEDQKTVAQLRRLAVPKAKYGGQDYRTTLSNHAATFKPDQLIGLLLQLCLVGALQATPGYFGADQGADLLATAKRLRINTAAIRREIAKQLKRKAPTRSAQTSAKPARAKKR